jgi:hypothetical protein
LGLIGDCLHVAGCWTNPVGDSLDQIGKSATRGSDFVFGHEAVKPYGPGQPLLISSFHPASRILPPVRSIGRTL